MRYCRVAARRAIRTCRHVDSTTTLSLAPPLNFLQSTETYSRVSIAQGVAAVAAFGLTRSNRLTAVDIWSAVVFCKRCRSTVPCFLRPPMAIIRPGRRATRCSAHGGLSYGRRLPVHAAAYSPASVTVAR